MARNERVCPGWSQPRRSSSSKSHSNRIVGSRTGDLDDLGDIMNLLSGCNKGKNRKETWPIHSSTPNNRSFQTPDCCLKNGRIHCSCLWSKNDFPLDNHKSRRNYRKATLASESIMPHERKMSFWHDGSSSSHAGGIKIAEEYVLDDNELCFDFYDMPFDMPKRHQLRKVGKVKTVSIIDTLSELASGATDREDEGGFSSAVSESAILGYDPYKSRVKHARHATNRKGHGLKENYLTSPASNEFTAKVLHKLQLNDNLSCSESACTSQIQNVHGDDGNFTCSSLKRTLKYLRKAVSSNVVVEEPHIRRHIHRHEEKDAFRQCFSDSEVREIPKPWTPARHTKPMLNSRSKSRSLLTVTTHHTPEAQSHTKHNIKAVPLTQPRSKVDAPDWIKKVFSAAKKGEVEKLKEGLRDIDPALVRNLSDDHGNNLWHTCSAQNHVQCLDWLCSRNQQQTDALKDENKHGFTPVALAAKHGSLLSVQWLVHNTISKSQLFATGNSRSLLHIAAKYGQETTVQWLLSYMNSQEININSTDCEGNTALHLAAKHGHINCVKALIFQSGSLKARNERGLKPINLAVKYSQVNCADYLLAMESCYNLAAVNLKQQSELLQFQKENAEVKSYFKELLTLTKRLQHRQRELVQTFTRIDHSSQFESDISERNEKCTKYVDEYTQLLAAVIADEEHRLLLVEERWKKSRKQPKLSDCKKLPIDVIRSQFTHILNKVNDQSPAVPSTPETSDDSWQSGDDDVSSPLPSSGSASNVIGSTPDVIHTLPNQNVPYMDTRVKMNDNLGSVKNKVTETDTSKNNLSDVSLQKKINNDIRLNPVRSVSGSARDVNLQVFFKQNPNLRQTSETCSVLEVLEPSSSDSDECFNKRHLKKTTNSEEEIIQSSSSSATETLSPSSCGPSSTESKKSGSRSSSSDSKHNVGGVRNANIATIKLSSSATRAVSESVENQNSENINNDSTDVLQRNLSQAVNFESNSLIEPDLIRGTQKKKRTPPNPHFDRESHQKELNPRDAALTDNPSISTEDSESLEADRSFCSAIDVPESLLSGQMMPDTSVTGTGVKKKSFLLKFALRGRWPSKHSRTRSSKNEISAEEFRETYSRSSESAQSPSQGSAVEMSTKKLSPFTVKELEKTQEATVFEVSCNISKGLDNSSTLPSCGDFSRPSIQHSPVALLLPRREPPPVPPRPPRDKEPSQIITSNDLLIGAANSSSCISSCMTESAVSLHDPYISNSSSNLWQSPDSKSLFRPASSASRVESPSRAEDNFPLNKSSSASTEMLSALDSSTAGRQSPAPSEVSKTESALSPPSDVSKTESARYLSQLGRIEESSHLSVMKSSNVQKSVTEENNVEECTLKDERSEMRPKKKSSNTRKHNPDKPWYEFSDEEDVITPQRYEVMSGRMRSSSEDEEVISS